MIDNLSKWGYVLPTRRGLFLRGPRGCPAPPPQVSLCKTATAVHLPSAGATWVPFTEMFDLGMGRKPGMA